MILQIALSFQTNTTQMFPDQKHLVILQISTSFLTNTTLMGHSILTQHEKWTPVSDFSETWFIHSMYQVIKPQEFLGSVVVWLHSYMWSKLWVFCYFPCTSCYIIYHIFGRDCFYENQTIQSCSLPDSLLSDI